MSETFEFKDRVSTNSDHRKLTFIGTHTGLPDSVVVKVERADENVTEAGTPLNAATMNALKESIANSAASIATTAASEAAAAKTAANTAKTEAAAAKTAANAAKTEAAAAKSAAQTAANEALVAKEEAQFAESQAADAKMAAQSAATVSQTAASRAETAADVVENSGYFYIDARTAAEGEIKAKIAEASAWGTEHKVRANLKIYGTLTHNNFEDLVLKSNVNYSFRYDCCGRGLQANNISNCSFTECYIKCVSSDSALHLDGCTDITVRDCHLINDMASNMVVGGTRICFDNCILSGGTYLHNTATLKGNFAEGSTVTYSNCVFNNTYDVLIDASSATGGNVILDHCVDGSGSPIGREKISCGGATFLISGEVPDGQGGDLTAVGQFYIDAETATKEEIAQMIATASAWGEAHSSRANLKIAGLIPFAKFQGLVLKSHVNYTFDVSTSSNGIVAENVSDIGFYECNAECIGDTGPIVLKNCTEITFRDCRLDNRMGTNYIENSDKIHFDHCVISGGTAWKKTLTMKDAGTAQRRVTFRDCELTNEYDILVDASGVTNANAAVVFADCVKGDGSYLPAGKITKGAGKVYLSMASEI